MEDHIVLYRQYRPLTFDDVVGQEAAVTALRQSAVAKKLAHAYLFCGQHGTGKTTIAKIFARSVNCEHPVNGNPCNECPTCKGILDGSILDVTEMDAASNNGVDDIRPILQEVNFAPTRTAYKVYIIDEVHMLSKGAFNALLKTIEEPPKHVIFLFATTESDKIPATIISRCQRYDFKRIPVDLISQRLKEVCIKSEIKASDDALRLIASRSDGALRDALSLLDQISAISGSEKEISSQDVERITGTVDSSFLFKMANCLIDARFDELIDLCEILNSSGKNQARFTLDLAAYFRDLLIIRVKVDPIIFLPYPKETIQDMYQTAAKVSADTLTGYISYLSKEYAELRKSPDIPVSFELMLMRLCGRKSTLPVTPIVIPDFEKQTDEKISLSVSNDVEPEVTDEETVTAAEEKTDEAAPEGAKTEEPAPDAEPAKETSSILSEPYRPRPTSAPSSLFSFTSFTGSFDSTDKPATPEASVTTSEPSIFSFIPKEETEPAPSVGTEEPEKPVIPSSDEPAGASLFGSVGIFSNLSSSFLKDLEGNTDPDESVNVEEEPVAEPLKPRSQLAEQADKSGLIVDGRAKDQVRAPSFTGEDADLALRWTSVTSKIKENNDNIAVILEHSSLRKDGDSAYIVFEDKDIKLLSNLKKSQAFRQLSSGIKDEFGAEHLYLCTVAQYTKQMKKNRESELDKKLDDLNERSRNMGVPTDVHFGD